MAHGELRGQQLCCCKHPLPTERGSDRSPTPSTATSSGTSAPTPAIATGTKLSASPRVPLHQAPLEQDAPKVTPGEEPEIEAVLLLSFV